MVGPCKFLLGDDPVRRPVGQPRRACGCRRLGRQADNASFGRCSPHIGIARRANDCAGAAV